MARFKVDFNGAMDRLEELERENHRLQAENAAMRPIVEAVAREIDPEDTHLFCTRCTSTAGRWLGHTHEMVHEPDCLITQARAFLAGHPQESAHVI